MKCRRMVGDAEATTGALSDPRRVTLPLSALAHAVLVTAILVVPALLSRELPAVKTGGISVPVFLPNTEVREIEVAEGSALLAPAAVAAVQEWRYVPTLLNGVPVAVRLSVVVVFRLG